MPISNPFLPRNQNTTQRAGFAAALIGVILILVLHNPLDGYTFEKRIELTSWEPLRNVCTKDEFDEASSLLATHMEFDDYVKLFPNAPVNSNSNKWTAEEKRQWRLNRLSRQQLLSNKCFAKVLRHRDDTLPIEEWASNRPLIEWLGSLVHLFGVVISILVASFVWISIFQDKNSEVTK